MMRVGVDIIELDRVERAVARFGDRFLHRIYTDGERAYCLPKAGRIASLAARFSAKEAVIKILGRRVPWRHIEVVNQPGGRPTIRLAGRAAALSRRQRFSGDQIQISLSHCRAYAIASAVVALADSPPSP